MTAIEQPPDTFENSVLEKKPSDVNLLQQSHEKHERNVKMVPPDGGWGWMVVLGSFLVMVLGTFPMFGFSILFSPILMTFGVSSTKISWIFNFQTLVWSCYAVIIGPLCKEFGHRKVAIFGGIANFLAVFLSIFAPSPDYLFLSFSFLGGIGGSTSFSLSFFIVSQYFQKHQGLALGITTLGSPTSIFLAPVVSNYLLENYGYSLALLIFSAIVLNQCVGGSLYQPVEWHMKPEEAESTNKDFTDEKGSLTAECHKTHEDTHENNKLTSYKETRKMSFISTLSSDSFSPSLSRISAILNDDKESNGNAKLKNTKSPSKLTGVLKSTYDNLKTIKYMRIHLLSWSYCFLMLGYTNFQMWIPFVVTDAGYSLETAAWCSSVGSIGNVIGRMVMSPLADRKFFNVTYGHMLGLLFTGTSIIAFSLVKTISLLMFFGCCFGLGVGFALSLMIQTFIKTMGVEMLPAVVGITSLFRGFGGITIGSLTGVVRDASQSYTYTLWMLGGLVFLNFCLCLLLPCAQRFDKRRKV